MKYVVIFTCKQILTVFKETVEATDIEQAKLIIKSMIKAHGLKLDHITSVIEL